MDLNVKMQNYKTSRGSVGKNLYHLGLSDEFPDTTPKIIVKLKLTLLGKKNGYTGLY